MNPVVLLFQLILTGMRNMWSVICLRHLPLEWLRRTAEMAELEAEELA